MAPRQPRTKKEALRYIAEDILSTSLEAQEGLYSVNKLKIQSYLKEAEENKTGNHAYYHYIRALISTVEWKTDKAKRSYCVALENDSSDLVILGNYATLLIDMNEYEEAKTIIEKLILDLKFYDYSAVNSAIRIALGTLDTSFLSKFTAIDVIAWDTDMTAQLNQLKKDIELIPVSPEEYREFIGLISRFTLEHTRQNIKPRFIVNNGLDRNLKIEVFLNIDADEASYLNAEFTTYFVNYVFDNDRHDLIGKFLVLFKQKASRYDGTENPDALYLGVNEELVA